MRPYRLVTPASRDLIGILDYLNEKSPPAASRLLAAFDQRLRLLATQPNSGHRRPEFRHPELRYITFEAYVIAYLPDTRPLNIIAVLHGSRDLTALFKTRP